MNRIFVVNERKDRSLRFKIPESTAIAVQGMIDAQLMDFDRIHMTNEAEEFLAGNTDVMGFDHSGRWIIRVRYEPRFSDQERLIRKVLKRRG